MSVDLQDAPVVEKKRKKGKPKKTKPNAKHRELINWILSKGYAEWNEEAGLLNTHTAALMEAMGALNLKGEFQTIATGKGLPSDRNCYCYPIQGGAWLVVRHGKRGTVVKEAPTWWQSEQGYTVCIIGREQKLDGPEEAIVNLALQTYEFFHDEEDAYVEVQRRGHPETLLVVEDTFRRLLRILTTGHLKVVAKSEWLKNSLDQLAAHALEEGPEYPVFVRLAEHDGKVYLDLCDRARNVIEIDGDGWRHCPNPPVRFRRTPTMLPLPMPVEGGKLDDLKPFLNLDADDLNLFVGVLVGFLNPDGPYPVLQLLGGDGRGKTMLARLVLLLLDSTKVVGCAPPAKVEDLMLAAKQRRILLYDNLSDMPKWLSDAFCRLSTGGAIERRTLYRNADTTAFIAKRPVIITGIRDVIEAPDLVSRTIKIDLPKVGKREREKQLLADFEAARPKILGWLLDGVASALKNQEKAEIDDLPRLADFGAWAQASEKGLGLDDGSILSAYRDAHSAAVAELLSSKLAQQVIALAPEGFSGNAKELAEQLGTSTSDADVKKLKDGLRDLVSTLEAEGVGVRFRRSHGKKLIEIQKL